jgi:tRNA pseudouridine-54 N-methylase
MDLGSVNKIDVIASAAKQSIPPAQHARMDCFVASLLATTEPMKMEILT